MCRKSLIWALWKSANIQGDPLPLMQFHLSRIERVEEKCKNCFGLDQIIDKTSYKYICRILSAHLFCSPNIQSVASGVREPSADNCIPPFSHIFTKSLDILKLSLISYLLFFLLLPFNLWWFLDDFEFMCRVLVIAALNFMPLSSFFDLATSDDTHLVLWSFEVRISEMLMEDCNSYNVILWPLFSVIRYLCYHVAPKLLILSL